MSTLPLPIRQPIAYLTGCLCGNAWLSSGSPRSPSGYLCLRVADVDFATTFATAITVGFGVPVVARLDERGYSMVRKNNGFGRFDVLRDFVPKTQEETAAWLRGLFDSQGNVVCVKKPKAGPRSWDRRISMLSTDHETLGLALRRLLKIGIVAHKTPWPCGAGHKGSKPVFAVMLSASRANFSRFGELIGSSIARKQAAIDLLPRTYQPDLSTCYAEAQAKGAAVRRARRDAGGIY